MLDYYHILGITSTASPKDVVAAYRAKCKILHPDVNPSEDATLQMQMVNEAYSVLSNHDLRRQYDIQYGYSATNTNGNYSEECSTPDFDYEANREGDTTSHYGTYNKKWWDKQEPRWYEDMIKCVVAANVLRLILKALFNFE